MNRDINQRLDEISDLLERRAFPIGTTRGWKKGPHAKTEQGWRKHGQSHMGNVDRPLPDARVSAFMASVPPMDPAARTEEQEEAEEVLDEKIQSPSTPKGKAAFVKSLSAWSKAASKVAGSYNDRLGDAKPTSDNERAQQAQLAKLLQAVSGQLGQIADIVSKF